MSLRFNIVYTPGTVPYLSFFVRSLLKWSDCSFRLVSNGCRLPERRLLQQLCAMDPRLSFHTVPTNGMTDHGTVLNYLQAITTEDYFCFMDSDLFAAGDFMTELGASAADLTGIFSGAPAWTTYADGILPTEFRLVSGVHHQTEQGTCLGSSYFAVYHNQRLTQCMQSTGVGFQTYQWHQLPPEIHQTLTAAGWQKAGYDTAKVLNLLLQSQGHTLRYAEADSLCHVGGFSFLQQDHRPAWKSRVAARIVHTPFGRLLQPLQKKWRLHRAFHGSDELSDRERQVIMARRTDQRDPTRRYFMALLMSLASGQPLPGRPTIGIAEIDKKIERATALIRQQNRCSLSHGFETPNGQPGNSPQACRARTA